MSWFTKLRNAIRPGRLDEDLGDEIHDHIERRTAQFVEQGLSPEDAARRAASAFGNITRVRESSREIRLWPAIEGTLQDVRYAARGMRKSPGFTITAILSLSLAIGANTSIYTIVDAAVLRPLPVSEAERLFRLAAPSVDEPGSPEAGERDSFSYPVFQHFREAAGGSAWLALFDYPTSLEVQIPDASAPVETAVRQYVSGDAFEILNVPPAAGRVFSMDDDRGPGRHNVVISYDYWRRRFHTDPAVIGRTLQIRGEIFSIAGVARDGFFGVEPGKFVDIWLPAAASGKTWSPNPGWTWFRIVGRLGPGATLEQVQARLQPGFHRFMEQIVEGNRTMPKPIQEQFRALRLRVHPAAAGVSDFRRTFERPLWIVLAIAAGILFIACANVASLLLARATARSSEMAMRISLGAARSRLIRQLLTESLLLSAVACGVGWLIARASAPLLVAMLSQENDPLRFALSMDTRVLAFCVAVSTAAAILFGLLPAWQASGAQPISTIRGGRQGGKLRLGRFFVSVQVAFAFCLVIAGAGFLFSLRNLFAVDTGFDSRGVALIQMSGDWGDKEQEKKREFIDQLRTRVAALPGIQGAAAVAWAIFNDDKWTEQVILPGKSASEHQELFYRVSPGYFATLRTPVLSGRDFESRDRDDRRGHAPVPVIVNQAFARRYFGTENPIGKRFERPAQPSALRHEIVGLVANANYGDLRQPPQPLIYIPIDGSGGLRIYVRSVLDLGSVVRLVEREARALATGVHVRDVTTLDAMVGNTILKEKLLAGIGGVFAALGLLLAAIGLFGLLNYSVARRTKEIGIRAALGANRREIVALVWRDLLSMTGRGLVVGLAGSIAVMTVLQSLLFGIRPADPMVLASASAVFLAAVIVAGTIPAGRAASVDPMIALRHE